MTIAYRDEEMLRMVDPATGTVDRRMFAEQDLYELELERIFARAWNFIAHDSQIPNPGDFFMTFIGEDRVICVRDNDGNPQVLVNTCRHRGNAVCRAEEGHATSFMCTYHGWTYNLKGALVGVPGFKEVYHEELDRENWGLIKAAQVETYKGFVFATMDPAAPTLGEFLGGVGRMGLDLIAERGDIKVVPGIQKYIIPCNWKLAVDNVYDYYHPQLSHASSTMSGYGFRRNATGNVATGDSSGLMRDHMVLLGDYGHGIGGPFSTPETDAALAGNPGQDDSWRERPEALKALGPAGIKSRGHPNIFPNLWVGSGPQVSLRHPKGPGKTEIWWFTLIDPEKDAELYSAQKGRANHTFGPAGMLEQDDGENWGQSTMGMRGNVAKRFPIHYAMGMGHGEIIDDEGSPPRIETHVNEHAQFWFYRGWADWMAAPTWDDLRANRTPPPQNYA